MKSIIAAGILLASGSAAIAGPYVNIENNAGSTGVEFDKSVLEKHVGYEGSLGENSSFYVQGGPAFVLPNGEALTTELSGKVGVESQLTEKVSAYAEVSAMTSGGVDFNKAISTNVKTGVTYRF
jgi:outer membrane autotransporter protein